MIDRIYTDADDIRRGLFEYALSLDIVDTHEHFISEELHLKRYLSFYHYFGYLKNDLASSGMNYDRLLEIPENEEQAVKLFGEIKPYWQYVRHGSYARPVLLSLKEFHNCDDLTEDTIIRIGRELNERNRPGHYDEVFDAAKIKHIINQSACGEKAFADSRFCYGLTCEFDYGINLRTFLERCPRGSFDEYIDTIDGEMAQEAACGAKQQKFFVNAFIHPLDKKEALKDFTSFRNDPKTSCSPLLTSAIAHAKLDLCAKHGIVAAVHTGVWGDITKLSPAVLFPVVEAHPYTIFDIYHLGIPYVRECMFLGKNYPNVYLDLCWTYCVSGQMVKITIDEMLDLVPVNKIFGFGGDVETLPEQVWGQLINALEILSAVMAHRIKNGRMDMDTAGHILKAWLYDNPKRVYKL